MTSYTEAPLERLAVQTLTMRPEIRDRGDRELELI